ncbi:DUF4832 domain-containing protein [Streptomyces sp. NPDC020379]|uniref:DUF4832 domain-containing protein n=1 Tax=Streptomyces sp. NPDC020379 TaxID=3365071 RepID=UPI003791166F
MTPAHHVRRVLPCLLFALVLLSPVAPYATHALERPAKAANEARAMAVDLLRNMRDNGDNNCPGKANGLYINWRYGTDPLEVNFGSNGTPDATPCARHDRLTDLRFLHNLLHYKKLAPEDTQFDHAITRYTEIVKSDFANGHDDRGWAYFEFSRLAALSTDPFFAATARSTVRKWLGEQPKPDRGDWAVEQAAAMIHLGTSTGDDTLVQQGRSRLEAAYRTYYNGQYHVILSQQQVKLGEVGQEIEALAWAGMADKARDLLTGAQALWDSQHRGYFKSLDFRQGTPPRLDKGKKEGGRQAEMLLAAQVAGDAGLTRTMLDLVTGPIYYTHGHGIVYEQAPDWSIRATPNGPENWVTTEAMGIAVNALLSVADTGGTPVPPRDSTTFTPVPLPDGQETAAPQRGAQYYGGEQPPPNWPLTDSYARFCWSKIEKERGQYDTGAIDQALADARSRGYTYGWRIMPVNTGDTGCLPRYLKQDIAGNDGGNGAYIPDFNAPEYLDRAQALMSYLGQRYDTDPRVGILDMSLYGCWGEWNESGDCWGGSGMAAMTQQNRRKLIDLQYQAFPHKRFLMLSNHQDSLDYALNATRLLPTGVRVDCLGRPSLGGDRDVLDNDRLAHDRWKTAPLYFEYCSNPDFALGAQDIARYHATFAGDGDGNLNDFSSYGDQDQRNMLRGYLSSGYRFRLSQLTLPGTLTPGAAFPVTGVWANANTAPAYLPWQTRIQLRSGTTVAWEDISRLDLSTPFADQPTGGEQRILTENFTLPDTIAHGTYQLCLKITDPGGTYQPLALANAGRGDDGTYCLGQVTVGT